MTYRQHVYVGVYLLVPYTEKITKHSDIRVCSADTTHDVGNADLRVMGLAASNKLPKFCPECGSEVTLAEFSTSEFVPVFPKDVQKFKTGDWAGLWWSPESAWPVLNKPQFSVWLPTIANGVSNDWGYQLHDMSTAQEITGTDILTALAHFRSHFAPMLNHLSELTEYEISYGVVPYNW